MANATEVHGVDTESLHPAQLSRDEWDILLQIEQRLLEVSPTAPNDRTASRDCSDSAQPAQFTPTYLAAVEKRYQRVLLLDGGRGTGKTSLLLTLINRWHGAAGALETPAWLTTEEELRLAERRRQMFPTVVATSAPKNIRVIRNLDFDPLPPGMPLIAGIVQAWRPLVEHYDRKTFRSDELCDDIESRRLMDSWHSVFRVAAGWSAVVGGKGLVEQVLDQEEQVRDWQDLRGKWLWFVNEVVRVGRCLKSDRLDDPPVFVIVIDDVDLQVERIRELLPALRILAHENVFFLIAADREHMIAMLRLDFIGQQRKLAAAGDDGTSTSKGAEDWATVLANAAFEKVFPTRNRWHLSKLSLSGFLRFPNRSNEISGASPSADTEKSNFEQLLTPIIAKGALAPKNVEPADAMISGLAQAAEAVSLDLPALSYRSAQQLWQAIRSEEDVTSQAAAVLAGLLSSNSDERAVVRRDKDRTIEVPAVGELTAFYRAGFVDVGEYDIVVSAQPDFWFISPDDEVISMRESRGRRFNFTAGLIAKTLQEGQFAIDATALRWETYLSLAWTTWRDIPATFAWTWHKHPRPDELLRHTVQWGNYVSKIYERTNLRERHAYAWIYFERQRCLNPSSAKAPTEIAPGEELPWGDLLRFDPPEEGDEDVIRDIELWQTVTLPLLARPEIGLPPDVQRRLLWRVRNNVAAKRKLRVQRRRLMTDAMFVAELQNRKVKNDLPGEEIIKQKIQYLNQRYEELNDRRSPWLLVVESEKPRASTKK